MNSVITENVRIYTLKVGIIAEDNAVWFLFLLTVDAFSNKAKNI